MFVLYGLLFAGMLFGIFVLLKPQSQKSKPQPDALSGKNIPNAANSNGGGNSQRAESVQQGTETTHNFDSYGSDNDDDRLKP